MTKSEPVLLIGVGYMGIEFAKVLKAQKRNFIAIGRGEKSADEFIKQTDHPVITGGLDSYLSQNPNTSDTAIVAISEEQLGSATIKLLNAGVKNILVEKPAGLDFEDVKKVAKLAKLNKAKVFVGYNRRFYASVEKANEIIKKDGGILSMHFDFTEAVSRIIPLVRAKGVKENWFLQNSTHVIDMAFFLAGNPKKMVCFTKDKLDWHKPAIFTGSGITEKGVLFSYHSDWKSAGRWAVEIMTPKHKLFFIPLEKLRIQDWGSFQVNDVNLNDKIDTDFKAGIYKEVESFSGKRENLCTIEEQVSNLKYYEKILKGQTL